MDKTIGVPKEIKKDEGRISLTPKSVKNITGIAEILIEEDAGLIAGYTNLDYKEAGGLIVESKKELFERSDVICKVKEPLEEDLQYLKENHLIFGYLHLSSSFDLTKKLMDIGLTGIAMELIFDNKHYPLLTPMSEIAGEIAFSNGFDCLEKDDAREIKVVVVGCGVVGEAAVRGAISKGCSVIAIDLDENKLKNLRIKYKENYSRVEFVSTKGEKLNTVIEDADIVIGAVLVPGGKPPVVITNNHIKSMRSGSVIVDVAIDQGGCVEDISPTTHSNPFIEREGVKVSAIANLPGLVPRKASIAISKEIEKYLPFFLDNNWINDISNNHIYQGSLQVHKGMLLSRPVADSLGIALSTLI